MKTGNSQQSPAAAATECPGPFRSFWMAGFECSCQINARGERLDMTAAVKHDTFAASDYGMIASLGILTARDGVRWHLMDRGGSYDFSSWTPMVEAARSQGVQVVWDLCHYGWPDDVDIFSAAFVDRFERFSRAVARYLKDTGDEPSFFTPMNEISFFTWAACRRIMFPFARYRDGELKRQLVRAAVAACSAILEVEPRARLVFAEPLIHIVPPRGKPADAALAKHESQFEAWEMLLGQRSPELGGSPRFLDIMGLNYYAANQWEVPGGKKLAWIDKPMDDRWRPLHMLLDDVYQRYRRPMFLAETSHYGIGRAPWIREVAREAYKARLRGVPLQGICLYPILDRFDWNRTRHWHNAGLFDLLKYHNGNYPRILNREYAQALDWSQRLLSRTGCR